MSQAETSEMSKGSGDCPSNFECGILLSAVRPLPGSGGGGGTDSGSSSSGASLQSRVDCALSGGKSATPSVESLNELARVLADGGETAALVRIWDALGGSKCATQATWQAVERLHLRGKGRIPAGTLRLARLDRAVLSPARRLHKICKGRRMSARSDKADDHLTRGLAWVAAQKEAGRALNASGGRARSDLCKEIKQALSINLETARGLVTKLKRKKAL